MSERPTPETDAAKARCFCRFDLGGTYDAEAEKAADGEWVPCEVSEALERELAEAREENAKLREVVKEAHEALDTCAQFIQVATIVEAPWDWEPVEQSKKAIESIAKLNTTT